MSQTKQSLPVWAEGTLAALADQQAEGLVEMCSLLSKEVMNPRLKDGGLQGTERGQQA